MVGKATGERLCGALVILASLAMMLIVAAPALTQEGVPVTGILTKPEITSYQYGTHLIVDEATGASYALESGSVDLDAYAGQAITIYGAPVPGYQDGQIEGGPNLLNVTGVDAPAEPVDPASGSSKVSPTPPGEEVAIQAAQAALQASDIAQSAEQSVQQATDTGDLQAASQAAEEAQQASEVAQVAAEEAQQAAEQTGAPAARAAAQEAQQAADEAQESSGAAQTVTQVARQAVQQVADIEENYAEALQAARSSDDKENNLAFATEYSPEEAGAVPAGTNADKDSGGEDTREDAASGKKTSGKKTSGKKDTGREDTGREDTGREDTGREDTGEAEAEEDTGGVVGSNTSTVTPARGSVPLLLGGSVLLLVGVFVARKLIR